MENTQVMYKSTRNSRLRISASEAILRGLSGEGGLFVPTYIPKLSDGFEALAGMDYKEVAYRVMKPLLADFTEEELRYCIENAYDSKFDSENIAPISEAGGAFYLELYHGQTLAFKDMALSILPYLMTTAARKNNIKNDILILTATSGDTGKAALAGFDSVEGTKIMVFYPKGGVSPIQEKQMVTQPGDNTKVVAIRGNFDDAQSGVKAIFADKELEKNLADMGIQLSSANSINIGRLIPQVAYYVFAYSRLVAGGRIAVGEKVNFVVPTGNFGNILAAYIACAMGVPVNKFICASNENKVLYDFFSTGEYNKNREFILTNSPSMDILISSNLERLIYMIAGEDDSITGELMEQLKTGGRYTVNEDMKSGLRDFYGGFATGEDTLSQIALLFKEWGYLCDTHTAVGSYVYDRYREETGDETKTVIASTASPFKFAGDVYLAIEGRKWEGDDFEVCRKLSEISGVALPHSVTQLENMPVKHDKTIEIKEMAEEVLSFGQQTDL